MSNPFPWPEEKIASYTAHYTTDTITVDGKLDEPCWQTAPRSPRFSDLVNGRPGMHDTRAAVLWNDTHLYVAYWVEEPDVRATYTERDSHVYEENDVEFFLAGKDTYYEFQVNALGTIYEVFFIWEDAYARDGYDKVPAFDRARPNVRDFGGVGFRHPRGKRVGFWNWDFPGLQWAVQVDGTINDASDRDRGWTVELAFPWEGMTWLAKGDGRALPPKEGDEWRMDFSRFNTYKEPPPAKDHGGWAWSPHGVWDSHVPELFTRVTFTREGG
jgi:hypothetical protein